MDEATMLAAVKTDLGITTNAYDLRLGQYIVSAQAAIIREGITLNDSIEDGNLVVMYAAWLWEKRKTGEGMPRSLRWQLNNRLFSEKTSGNNEPAISDNSEES